MLVLTASFLAMGIYVDCLRCRSDSLPQLRGARVTGARLPGGRVFAFAGLGAAFALPTLEAPQVRAPCISVKGMGTALG